MIYALIIISIIYLSTVIWFFKHKVLYVRDIIKILFKREQYGELSLFETRILELAKEYWFKDEIDKLIHKGFKERVRKEIDNTIRAEINNQVHERISGEYILDEIVERILKKQLK